MKFIAKVKVWVFFAHVVLKNELRLFYEDAKKVCLPWVQSPLGQIYKLAVVLRRTFFPHDQNNRFSKVLISAFSLVWFVSFLGVTFGDATPPTTSFVMFTAFVFTLVGSVVGVEWDKLDPISISFGGGGGDGENKGRSGGDYK